VPRRHCNEARCDSAALIGWALKFNSGHFTLRAVKCDILYMIVLAIG